ncbi:ATP-binding protein [Clostridium sp. SYSU_GA19001]|uniref:ATP-binding protein n=1 Tax=Clostridium caldaquaticum TaxID=2940653 RepID=UPI00207795BD|nr:ATP-binding protein [Clostridium caldaquaticum]MCM8710113.1 ATP-binding protein [Clostridium caldaquaticum]
MELVVLSGKGGTGKTTIATALSELAKDVIRIDCDVDAPNLYLFYKGRDIEKRDFIGGKKAFINKFICSKCRKCETVCKFHAIDNLTINAFVCEGCGTCALICPEKAIKLKDEKTADTFVTKLDKGIISRAEMEIGSDGSGKLITYLRKNAKRFSDKDKLTIIDGSPGIGCSVISSITGSDAVLAVTEPTKSGLEDLKRVVDLCEHFGIFTMVCINKYDINEDMSTEIEKFIKEKELVLVGKIPYDDIVMKSINELKPIIYYPDSKAYHAIRNMWSNIEMAIN